MTTTAPATVDRAAAGRTLAPAAAAAEPVLPGSTVA